MNILAVTGVPAGGGREGPLALGGLLPPPRTAWSSWRGRTTAGRLRPHARPEGRPGPAVPAVVGVPHPGAFRGQCRLLGRLRRLVRSERVSVVHAGKCLPEGLTALGLKAWIGVPYVCYVHGEEMRPGDPEPRADLADAASSERGLVPDRQRRRAPGDPPGGVGRARPGGSRTAPRGRYRAIHPRPRGTRSSGHDWAGATAR